MVTHRVQKKTTTQQKLNIFVLSQFFSEVRTVYKGLYGHNLMQVIQISAKNTHALKSCALFIKKV